MSTYKVAADRSEPAFPCLERGGAGLELTASGLTKREYFAALAMQALLSRDEAVGIPETFALAAYDMADAMIAEGKK